MYILIIIFPLIAAFTSGLFGRKLGVLGSQLISCVLITLTTLLSMLAYFEVGFNNLSVSLEMFRWVDSELLNVTWGFNFDSLTVSMLIPVLIVSTLVHIYSIEYMSSDPHCQRFFSYLSLFTFMMIILVTANNYLLMFVGWEGVGVCSYLLVNFWYTRIAANQSSISAFLTNRVGDCLLTIGMFIILWSFGNLDFSTVFTLAPFVNVEIITLVGICLLIGAMAKSSQIGLHVWLPLAMEGPTPVSALIHAATMVTAGVYLLIRSSPLIEYSSTVLICCLWIGAITTVFSSLVGAFQQDIKKVIAYSTMSQLGLMVVAVGLSSYNLALFHLINHAFYKALLFLGAGAVIHAVYDNQDFRKYGGLKGYLPLTYSVMLIASLSLMAFPFMTGFYSKDLILESAFAQFTISSIIVYYIAVIGAMFTTLYSVKILYLTFLTNPNGPIINYKYMHENGIFINLPLIILAVFSIFFGYVTKDIYVGLGSGFFGDNSIFIHPLHENVIDTEFANITFYKLLPFFFLIILSVLSLITFEFNAINLCYIKLTLIGYNVYSLLSQRFFIEAFYNNYITNIIIKLGGQTSKILDKGSIELIGPYGLEKALSILSLKLDKLSTGVITSYALYILIGFITYITIPYLYITDNPLLLLIIISVIVNVNKADDTHISTYTKTINHSSFKGYLELLRISINNFFMHIKKYMDKLVIYRAIAYITNSYKLIIPIIKYVYISISEINGKDIKCFVNYRYIIFNNINKYLSFNKADFIIFIAFTFLILIKTYWPESGIYYLIAQIHVWQFIIFCIHKIVIDKFSIIKYNFSYICLQIKTASVQDKKLVLIGVIFIILVTIIFGFLFIHLFNFSYLAFLIIIRRNLSKYICKYLKNKIIFYTHTQAKKRLYVYRKFLAIYEEFLELCKLNSLIVMVIFITNYHLTFLALLIHIHNIGYLDHSTNMAFFGLYLYLFFTFNSITLKVEYPMVHTMLTYVFEFILVLSCSYFIDMFFAYLIENLLILATIIKMNIAYWCLTGRQPTGGYWGSYPGNREGFPGGDPMGYGGGNGGGNSGGNGGSGAEAVFARPIDSETTDFSRSREDYFRLTHVEQLPPSEGQYAQSPPAIEQTGSSNVRERMSLTHILRSTRRQASPTRSILHDRNQRPERVTSSYGRLSGRNPDVLRQQRERSRSPVRELRARTPMRELRARSPVREQDQTRDIESGDLLNQLEAQLPYKNDGNYGNGHVCQPEEKDYLVRDHLGPYFLPPNDLTISPGRIDENGLYIPDNTCIAAVNCGHSVTPRLNPFNDNSDWDLKWGPLPSAGDLNTAKVLLEKRNSWPAAMTPSPCTPCRATIQGIWNESENSSGIWVSENARRMPIFNLLSIEGSVSSTDNRADNDLNDCINAIVKSKNILSKILNQAEETGNGSVLHHIGHRASTRLLALDASYSVLEKQFRDKDVSGPLLAQLQRRALQGRFDFSRNLRNYNQRYTPWTKNYCSEAIAIIFSEYEKKHIKIDDHIGK